MAIENENRKTAVMQGDGTSVKFPFSFRIGREEDLVVYVKKGPGAFQEQILNTDYELTDLITDYNGNITGGNIKYPKIDENAEEQPAPLTNEDYIYAIRETPRNQLETSEQVSFKSKDIERGLDKACMQIQELTEDVSRCVKIEEWQDIDPDEIIDAIYDAVGDAGDYATAAGNSANQASVYANNASTSATNSQKWAEGSDADVSQLGGTHSSKGWAEHAEATVLSMANKDLDNLTATGEAKFNSKVDLNAANLSDAGKSLIAGLGTPSSVLYDLTLGASGSSVSAPADGYFRLSGTSTGAYSFVAFYASVSSSSFSSTSGQHLCIYIPIQKGQSCTYFYSNITDTYFAFVYAEGSKQEAN